MSDNHCTRFSCKTMASAWRSFVYRLLQRSRKLSADHKNAWKNYDKVLLARTTIFFFIYLALFLIQIATETTPYDKSRKYIEQDGERLEERVADLFPFLKWALICLAVGRLLVVFPALKLGSRGYGRFLFFYHLLFVWVKMALPADYGDFIGTMTRDDLVVAYLGMSFELTTGLLPVLATQLYVEVYITVYIYGKPFD